MNIHLHLMKTLLFSILTFSTAYRGASPTGSLSQSSDSILTASTNTIPRISASAKATSTSIISRCSSRTASIGYRIFSLLQVLIELSMCGPWQQLCEEKKIKML